MDVTFFHPIAPGGFFLRDACKAKSEPQRARVNRNSECIPSSLLQGSSIRLPGSAGYLFQVLG
jgi:hypothetical protein